MRGFHHVKIVKISINDSLLAEQRFKNQTDNNTQQTDFVLDSVKTEDTLTIEARCSLWGSLKKEFPMRDLNKQQ